MDFQSQDLERLGGAEINKDVRVRVVRGVPLCSDSALKIPITRPALVPGEVVYCLDLVGETHRFKVIRQEKRTLLENDVLWGVLEFEKEPRGCWVVTALLTRSAVDGFKE